MKFKKISDTTIRCIISQEEMWEKGIEIDDFLEHKDKTEDFLRDIVEQARDELDMDSIGHAFSVQMSVMRTGEISLLIVEDDQENMQRTLESFRERLQGFQEALQAARKMAEARRESESADVAVEAQEDAQGEDQTLTAEDTDTEKKVSVSKSTEESPAAERETTSHQETSEQESGEDTTYGDMPLWVIMDTMDDVLTLCLHLADRNLVTSRLYKYQEQYYLRLQFANYKKDITDAIMTLSEFCTLAFTEEQGGYAVAEHGQLLWGDDAVEQLAGL